MTRASTTVLLALALACGSSNDPSSSELPPTNATNEAPTTMSEAAATSTNGTATAMAGGTATAIAGGTATAIAGGTASATTAEAPRPTITTAQRRELRAAIREGRTKTRAGDHAGALAAFRRAIAIDGQSARLRCEAGFVAYRAGVLDEAERWIQLALGRLPNDPPEPLKVPVAMCLFNAGLVYEARDRKADAHDAWTRSLALRPNATVQRRLDALGVVQAETPVVLTGSFEEIARRLRDAYCESGSAGFTREDLESCDQIEQKLRPPTGASSSRMDARLIEHSVIVMGGDMSATLVVKAGEQARAVPIASLYSPGAMGMSADYEVHRFELVDVIPGGAPEVVLQVHQRENDEDMGVCERTGGTDERTWVCGLLDGAIRCASIPMESTSYFERDEGCCEEEEDCEPPTSETTGYRYVVAFEAGDVVITRSALSEAFTEQPLEDWVGRHPLEAMLRQEARMNDATAMGTTY